MVEGGMPPIEALVSATKSAAELLGKRNELGGIAPGKLADVVAFPRSPLLDIAVMGEVSLVMKQGVVYKRQ